MFAQRQLQITGKDQRPLFKIATVTTFCRALVFRIQNAVVLPVRFWLHYFVMVFAPWALKGRNAVRKVAPRNASSGCASSACFFLFFDHRSGLNLSQGLREWCRTAHPCHKPARHMYTKGCLTSCSKSAMCAFPLAFSHVPPSAEIEHTPAHIHQRMIAHR